MEINKRIKKFRLQQKLSQKKFAYLIGTTQQNISNYENGVAQPSIDCLAKIAQVFSVSLDELLLGDASQSSTDRDILNILAKLPEDLDALAVAAYDRGKLIGLAGCSADCEAMWQIGVDVLPEYRRKGVASALTSRLAIEAIHRGKVPFYCAAWSNIRSVRNAIKSGFRPTWIEMTAKSIDFVSEMNR
ncbi:GNAT family N-acetyltransferase [Caproiciproducens sp.]|uniref:GNAT family N-acetyltransferase n=1 Tax=Caproiciproducens sp. TaxID=1954376 RepID=UPI003FA4C1BA